MRVALLVVAGLAALTALAGVFKGLVTVLTTILLGASEGYGGQVRGASPFLLLWGGTEGAAAVFCLLGIAGAGFAIARRPRTGAWLVLVGAVGATASAYAYILLQPVAMGPAFEPYLSPGLLPVRRWHALALFPVPPLLLGAALAFLASGTPGNQARSLPVAGLETSASDARYPEARRHAAASC